MEQEGTLGKTRMEFQVEQKVFKKGRVTSSPEYIARSVGRGVELQVFPKADNVVMANLDGKIKWKF